MSEDRPQYQSEKRTIHVTAYRDADGHPTCCADWNSARCIFVQTRKLGLVEVCALSGKDIPRQPADLRRGEFVTDPSDHLLRPVEGCIVWAHEIEGAREACAAAEIGRQMEEQS